MRIIYVLVAFGLLLIYSCGANTTGPATVSSNSYTVPDDAAIKKAVDDAYASISFNDGKSAKLDSIHFYFIPQAQLINYITDTAQILSINQFVTAYKSYVQNTKIQDFTEVEMYGKTDQFGNIAQRISAYKTYVNSKDIVKERGVNSFQLIKTLQGWKVSSIIWDVEKNGLIIPDYYLGKK